MGSARLLGGLVAVTALAVGGCSSDDDASSAGASSSSASSSAALCSSAEALRSSIADLGDVQVAEDGTAALQDSFARVGDDVDHLVDEAQDRYSRPVADVESAVGDLGAALQTLGSSPSSAALGDAAAAARTVVQEAGVLVDDVSSSC